MNCFPQNGIPCENKMVFHYSTKVAFVDFVEHTLDAHCKLRYIFFSFTANALNSLCNAQKLLYIGV